MDDIVRQAMAKWPHVPHCYDWLGLDARGHWYMRDALAQALGAFASKAPGAKGSLLQHDKLIAFIARNYASDAQGQWYFQNGPQRVYVELEACPWVWRVDADLRVQSHTGLVTHCITCLTDAQGWVYLHTPLGLGLVHTLDVGWVAAAIESGQWSLVEVKRQDLAARYGYVLSPAARNGAAQAAP
jgi:hypothetical protein